MQRLPGTALLCFGKHRCIRAPVALRAHVGVAGDRPALQILRQQTVGASDRGVGVVAGPMAPMPEFIAISLRIGPLMIGIVANDVVLLDRAVSRWQPTRG